MKNCLKICFSEKCFRLCFPKIVFFEQNCFRKKLFSEKTIFENCFRKFFFLKKCETIFENIFSGKQLSTTELNAVLEKTFFPALRFELLLMSTNTLVRGRQEVLIAPDSPLHGREHEFAPGGQPPDRACQTVFLLRQTDGFCQ